MKVRMQKDDDDDVKRSRFSHAPNVSWQNIDLGTMHTSTAKWYADGYDSEAFVFKHGHIREDSLLTVYRELDGGEYGKYVVKLSCVLFGFKRKLLLDRKGEPPGFTGFMRLLRLEYIKIGNYPPGQKIGACLALPQILRTDHVKRKLKTVMERAGYAAIRDISDISALALHYVSNGSYLKKWHQLWREISDGRFLVIVSLGAGFSSVGVARLHPQYKLRTVVVKSEAVGTWDGVAYMLEAIRERMGARPLQEPLLWGVDKYYRAAALFSEMDIAHKRLSRGGISDLKRNDREHDEIVYWLGDTEAVSLKFEGKKFLDHLQKTVFKPVCDSAAALVKSIKTVAPIEAVLWAGLPGFHKAFEPMLQAAVGEDIECIGVRDERCGVAKGLAFYSWLCGGEAAVSADVGFSKVMLRYIDSMRYFSKGRHDSSEEINRVLREFRLEEVGSVESLIEESAM